MPGYSRPVRALLVAGTIVVPPLTVGCGFLFSHGPPANHEQLSSINCTESNAGPIVDIVWGGLNVLGALTVASDPSLYENSDAIIASGLTWGAISGTAAVVGFGKSAKCKEARALLAQRQGQVPAGGVDVVAAVTVTPASDTLRVGGRLQLQATATASSGLAVSGRAFFWTSSNDAIASVSAAGLVIGNAPGSVVIAARTGTVVGTARLVIVAP